MVAVGVGAVARKFTVASLLPVPADLSFVVQSEVLDIPDHLLARAEVHLLFYSFTMNFRTDDHVV